MNGSNHLDESDRRPLHLFGLAFVSDESFSESFAGIYAIYKHVAPAITPSERHAGPCVSRQN